MKIKLNKITNELFASVDTAIVNDFYRVAKKLVDDKNELDLDNSEMQLFLRDFLESHENDYQIKSIKDILQKYYNPKYDIKDESKSANINLEVDKQMPAWIKGTITIDNNKYEVYAKVFTTGSDFGIDKGPISKLYIKDLSTERVIVNYDRGWDKKPEENDKNIYNEIVKLIKDFREKNPLELEETLTLNESVDAKKYNFVISWIADHIHKDDILEFCKNCNITIEEWENQTYPEDKKENIYNIGVEWIKDHIHEDDISQFEQMSNIKLTENKQIITESKVYEVMQQFGLDTLDSSIPCVDRVYKDLYKFSYFIIPQPISDYEIFMNNMGNILEAIYDDEDGVLIVNITKFVDDNQDILSDIFEQEFDEEDFVDIIVGMLKGFGTIDEYNKLNEAILNKQLITESVKNDSEKHSFQEIIDMMEQAESYSELYAAAKDIENKKLQKEVIDEISVCEKDGDSVEVAYSVVTSDLLDMYAMQDYKNIENLNESMKINEDVISQLMKSGMTRDQALDAYKFVYDLFNKQVKAIDKNSELIEENIEDYQDKLSIEYMSKIFKAMRKNGWDGDISTAEKYFNDIISQIDPKFKSKKDVERESLLKEFYNQDGFPNDEALQKYFQHLKDLPDEVEIEGIKYKMEQYGGSGDNAYVIYTDINNSNSYIKVFYSMNKISDDDYKGVKNIKGVSDLRENKSSKKESDALQFIKDVEDAKLLGWDGKDETFAEYMQKVKDMRQVNKELKKESKDLSKINLKDMYMKTFPEDSFLFDDLRSDTTLQDVVDALNSGEDIYDVIFGETGGDSVVRENIFGYLADLLNIEYKDIYNLWLHPDEYKKLNEAEERYSNIIKFQNKLFRYDFKNNVVQYIAKDDNGDIIEIDSVGLSKENWLNKEAREEYLQQYCKDIDEEVSYLSQDIIDEFNLNEGKDEILSKETFLTPREKEIFDNMKKEPDEKTIYDHLVDRIGQKMNVGEFNNFLQSLFAQYNNIFLLNSDLENISTGESLDVVIKDDEDDTYTITIELIDSLEGIIEITDVN